MVQWLGFCVSMLWGMGLIPIQGTKNLQAVDEWPKKKSNNVSKFKQLLSGDRITTQTSDLKAHAVTLMLFLFEGYKVFSLMMIAFIYLILPTSCKIVTENL